MKTRVVPHRRRRQGRTDYRKRLRLLKSGKPRLVVRRFLNSVQCQVISYEKTGDKTIASASSLDLKKAGWKAHAGNIPAAYLVGFLCGLRAKKSKIKECVLDTGLFTSTQGSSLYAALKGALDAGLNIPHSEDILPSPDRISGKHIASFADTLKKEKPEKYKKQFSNYLKNKLQPEELPKHFEETKAKIAKL
ncbi:MAG: 50S ribosomal protein L18 [Candidatus Aenigmatarchaeota archaeon]|nr:MAG: 50S ribosomal protein L18 [Candidatus Aenigmarchaeota archaeon]RLJ07885.1 MAG: 50S ribosomal protein L18 [Candidatus Aenigmarchaeota archaeon]RLJ08015.1 MAG: 50S ribosomal protein L18 [Candidatus Aenigmarchaeota archaeon]